MGKEKGFVGVREREKLYQVGDGGYIGVLWSYIHFIILKHKPWKWLGGPAWCILARI